MKKYQIEIIAPHVQMQLIGPVSDDLVLRHRPVVDLVLEDVVASGGVAVLVKGDRSPCTSCQDTDTQKKVQMFLRCLQVTHQPHLHCCLLKASTPCVRCATGFT